MFSQMMLPVFEVKENHDNLVVGSGVTLIVKENRGLVMMSQKSVLSAHDVEA